MASGCGVKEMMPKVSEEGVQVNQMTSDGKAAHAEETEHAKPHGRKWAQNTGK